MCAVSVIYDMFNQMPDTWFSKPRLNLFHNMLADAKQFDIEADQSDCEDEEKAKLLERIEYLEKQLKDK